MKNYLMLLPVLALLALPVPAIAQEDDAAAGEEASAGDQGVGGEFGEQSGGFDSMYAGGEGPKDIYGYVANEKATPAGKRDKAAAEARKKRDEMVAKMKKNSERLLAQQKERAWKASHPGQPYPGAEEASDSDSDYGYGGDGDGAITDGGFGKDEGGGGFEASGGGGFESGGGSSDDFGGDSE